MADRARRCREAYIVEALLEYLISLLVTGAFLAAILKQVGVSDAVTGVVSSIISLACVTQLFSGMLEIFFVQERTGFPSIRTVQAPQTPMPQPTFTPVRPIRRRTVDSLSFSGSTIRKRWTPLISKVILVSFANRIILSLLLGCESSHYS